MSRRTTKEERLWIVWLLTALVTFGILEADAIRKQKHHGTLTYTLRKQLGIEPVRPWKSVGAGMIIAFSFWFAVHIVTGGLVPKMMRITKELDVELEQSHGPVRQPLSYRRLRGRPRLFRAGRFGGG